MFSGEEKGALGANGLQVILYYVFQELYYFALSPASQQSTTEKLTNTNSFM